ncbi:hypothetical protein ACFL0W_02880 [Nanoarchaeota archaeon]
MKFNTKLWKRSQKSYATTIPQIVLLSIDESKEHKVIWEFDKNSGKWTIKLEEVKNSKKSNKNKIKGSGANET